MTKRIESIAEVAANYDAIVFDQWGVLHDGSTPYPGARACVSALATGGGRLAVLSNSGKRSAPNADRIGAMGFEMNAFVEVMTSGEALWRDIEQGRVPERRFHAIERAAGDASLWAHGLPLTFCDLERAEAILLMGLPDGSSLSDWHPTLQAARRANLPIYCSNPDRKSPRADGLVISPGALAFAYQDMGGAVTFYGKPHGPIFRAVQDALGAKRLLMVGDSLEHDIAGAANAGWDSLLVTGGLYADRFQNAEWQGALAELTQDMGMPQPTYLIGEVQ